MIKNFTFLLLLVFSFSNSACRKEEPSFQTLTVRKLTSIAPLEISISLPAEITFFWNGQTMQLNTSADQKATLINGWYEIQFKESKILLPKNKTVSLTRRLADYIFLPPGIDPCPVTARRGVFLLYTPQKIVTSGKCNVFPIPEESFSDPFLDPASKLPVIFFFSEKLRFRG